jgi:hypothetical protein
VHVFVVASVAVVVIAGVIVSGRHFAVAITVPITITVTVAAARRIRTVMAIAIRFG